MIFRRKSGKATDTTPGADAESTGTDAIAGTETDAPVASTGTAPSQDAGPFDSADVAIEPGDTSRIDLGSLLIGMTDEMQLTLQVDDQQQEVIAALVIQDDSAIEVRAFAAPKKSGIWAEVREEMIAEADRMGGTVEQADGPFGTELVAEVPVTDPDGNSFLQKSRVVGVDGPRWFLRGTILGRAAEEPEAGVLMENAFRNVIVVRGDEPMAPREPLPLTMPEIDPDQAEQADDDGPGA